MTDLISHVLGAVFRGLQMVHREARNDFLTFYYRINLQLYLHLYIGIKLLILCIASKEKIASSGPYLCCDTAERR